MSRDVFYRHDLGWAQLVFAGEARNAVTRPAMHRAAVHYPQLSSKRAEIEKHCLQETVSSVSQVRHVGHPVLLIWACLS